MLTKGDILSRALQKLTPFYIKEQDSPAKRELLKAALSLYVRQGLDGTSIRDIAAEAGYSNPALFKHFAGKEDLSLYLFESCYQELIYKLFNGIDYNAAFQENLALLVTRTTDFIDESQDAFLYVQDNLRHFWPQASSEVREQSLIGQLRRLLEAGRKQGRVATDVPLEIQISALSGALPQFARLLYFGEIKGNARASSASLLLLMQRMLSK